MLEHELEWLVNFNMDMVTNFIGAIKEIVYFGRSFGDSVRRGPVM